MTDETIQSVTPEMLKSGREVLDAWLSFWQVNEVDFRADELLTEIYLSMADEALKQKRETGSGGLIRNTQDDPRSGQAR